MKKTLADASRRDPRGASLILQASLAVTVTEAARLLRLDPRTIRAMVRAGELEGNRCGRVFRVSKSSVVRWLNHRYARRARRASES